MKGFVLGKFLVISFSFLLVSQFSIAQNELKGGTYVYVKTYAPNNNVTNNHPPPYRKIMVIPICFWGCTAGLSNYNSMIGMWEPGSMTFNYRGANNGWYIFQVDLGMMGVNSLYIYRDDSFVRVKYSFDNGYYHEYRKMVEGEDIDRGPTY